MKYMETNWETMPFCCSPKYAWTCKTCGTRNEAQGLNGQKGYLVCSKCNRKHKPCSVEDAIWGKEADVEPTWFGVRT
jgi:hypothetical protein